MRNILSAVLITISAFGLRLASADAVIVDSGITDSYYFIDTYEVMIDRPAAEVWPHVLDVASWMYQFDMIHEAGPSNAEGQIYRLYEGEPFLIELAKVIPGRLVVLVNHPSTMQSEDSVGIAMLSLTELDGKTIVSNFMSRHYNWPQAAPNPLRERRGSLEFQEDTRAIWNGFLNRLRELSDGTYAGN